MAQNALLKFFRVSIAALTIASTPAVAWTAELAIVGTGDGMDVLRALGAAFTEENKSVRIEVPPSIHSRGGIVAVASGKETLGRVARKLTDAEAEMGIIYKPIFRSPSAIYVHPTSGVKELTTSQLADIYAGRVTNWKEVGGADRRIRVVRREEPDSTVSVMRASMPGWKDIVITEKSKVATTTQDAENSVREEPGAIGFGPYSKSLEKGTVVLKINGHYPTDVNYLSSVELALIYKESTMTPEARAFISFVKTKKAKEVIARLGSVPIAK